MSIKTNLIYSTILTFSTYLVPLLVFPYISRILGADCIGAIDTIDSIIDYCILFSMMGMSTLGIREVAKHKDNYKELQRVFNNLFWLNAISTGIIFMILLIASFCLPDLSKRLSLLTIGTFKLLANLFWIEWFYRGLEDFKYITIRSVIVRGLFIISVFLFVKNKADFLVYYALFVGIVVLNAICNWTHKRKMVSLQFTGINLQQYLKPFIMLGLFAILSAIYTKLSLPLLSFTCGDKEAGYYSTAIRMYQVIIALISSLISVLIPRMSILIKEKKIEEISHLYRTAFQLLFFLGMPVIIFIDFLAPDVVSIFAGKGFEQAILPMRIVMAQVLVIGTEQIFILQLLIPMKEDKIVVKAGLCGVVTWIILSIVLVPKLHSLGTAIVWVAAEFVVMTIASIHVNKVLHFKFPWNLFGKSCIHSFPYVLLGSIGIHIFGNPILRISFITTTFLIYTTYLWQKIKKTAQLV